MCCVISLIRQKKKKDSLSKSEAAVLKLFKVGAKLASFIMREPKKIIAVKQRAKHVEHVETCLSSKSHLPVILEISVLWCLSQHVVFWRLVTLPAHCLFLARLFQRYGIFCKAAVVNGLIWGPYRFQVMWKYIYRCTSMMGGGKRNPNFFHLWVWWENFIFDFYLDVHKHSPIMLH